MGRILGTSIRASVAPRFHILIELLKGEEEVERICRRLHLAPESVRRFLNKLVEGGYAEKRFFAGQSGPVCFVSKGPHNDYWLTEKGVGYARSQLKAWVREPSYEPRLAATLEAIIEFQRQHESADGKTLNLASVSAFSGNDPNQAVTMPCPGCGKSVPWKQHFCASCQKKWNTSQGLDDVDCSGGSRRHGRRVR